MSKTLIITSIADDQHSILNQFAKECKQHNIQFIVIGDTKSPSHFTIEGCDYWSVEKQLTLPFKLAELTPTKHYSRKNLGYLIAMANGTTQIVETDDDNIPRSEFWLPKSSEVKSHLLKNVGWINVYQFFTNQFIWPRGYPLEELQKKQLLLTDFKLQI